METANRAAGRPVVDGGSWKGRAKYLRGQKRRENVHT
jgi:hypothetical protein